LTAGEGLAATATADAAGLAAVDDGLALPGVLRDAAVGLAVGGGVAQPTISNVAAANPKRRVTGCAIKVV
jgi:hypothetical protein